MLERFLLLLGGIEVVLGGLMTAYPTLLPPWVGLVVIGIGLITIGVALYLLRGGIWNWLLNKALERDRKAREAEEDPYAYGLSLDQIDQEDRRVGAPGNVTARHVRFMLQLRNTVSRPLEYEIKNLEINGNKMTEALSHGAVIPSQTQTTFYSHWTAEPVESIDKPYRAIVVVEMTYGAPKKHTRRVYKKMQIELLPSSRKVNLVYEANTDEPISQ